MSCAQRRPLTDYGYLHWLASSKYISDHAFFRLYFFADCYTPKELAAFLGVHIKDVIRAQKGVRKGDNIPAEWLIVVLRTKKVHPDWIVTGYGSVDWACVFDTHDTKPPYQPVEKVKIHRPFKKGEMQENEKIQAS